MYKKLTPGQYKPLFAVVEHYKKTYQNNPSREPTYWLLPIVNSDGHPISCLNGGDDSPGNIASTSREVLNAWEEGGYITLRVTTSETPIPSLPSMIGTSHEQRVIKSEYLTFILTPEAIEYEELMKKGAFGQWLTLAKKDLSEDTRKLVWTVLGGVLIVLVGAFALLVLGLSN